MIVYWSGEYVRYGLPVWIAFVDVYDNITFRESELVSIGRFSVIQSSTLKVRMLYLIRLSVYTAPVYRYICVILQAYNTGAIAGTMWIRNVER